MTTSHSNSADRIWLFGRSCSKPLALKIFAALMLAVTVTQVQLWGDDEKAKEDPVQALLKELGDDDADKRSKAFEKLRQMGSKVDEKLIEAYWGRDKELRTTVEELIQALGSDDWNVRRRATLVLSDIGIPALSGLEAARKSEDFEVAYRARILVERIRAKHDKELNRRARVREALTQIIGERGQVNSLPILADALKNGSTATRRAASKSLARMKGANDKRRPLLVKALGDNDPWVAAFAAQGLAGLGDDSAVQDLIKASQMPPKKKEKKKVEKPKPQPKGKTAPTNPPPAGTPIGKKIEMRHGLPVGSMPPIAGGRIGGKSSSSAFRRSRAVRALGRYAERGNEAAARAIVTALKDDSWIVRIEATYALKLLAKQAKSQNFEFQYPATIKAGLKLSKELLDGAAQLSREAARSKPEEASVAAITTETMTGFLKSLRKDNGQLVNRAKMLSTVQAKPFVAAKTLSLVKKLIEDKSKRNVVKRQLSEILSEHVVSFRTIKDRKTFVVSIDRDGSLVTADSDGPRRYDPDDILRVQINVAGDSTAEGEEKVTTKGQDQIMLTSGERLTGRLLSLDEKSAKIEWTAGENLNISSQLISAISLQGKLSDATGDYLGGEGEVIMKNGSRLLGKVKGITEKDVLFDLNGRTFPLSREETLELRFERKSNKKAVILRGHFTRVRLLGGDRLWGTLLDLNAQGLLLGSESMGLVQVPLARLNEMQFSSSLGFDADTTVVANYSGNAVVFMDLKGNVVRKIPISESPWDVERLQHGHLLVSLYRSGAVIELDEKGKEIWRVSGFSQPSDADRLPNGHTLIADRGRGRIIELDYKRNVVFQYSGVYCSDVERLANGNTLVADSSRGRIMEIDPFGNVIWELNGYRSPQDIDSLDGGHYLVTERSNRVLEIDRSGRVIWEKKGLRSPTDADRLENGNTLITESGANRVIEVAPDGRIVREFKGLTYPSEANR